MKIRLPIAAATLALFGALAVSPLTAAAATQAPPTQAGSGITQTINAVPVMTSQGAGTLTGQLTIARFFNQNGHLMAAGTITGTISSTSGTALATLSSQPFTAPVTPGDPTCTILVLNVGAIHLDLLGLVVDTNPITVTITAVSGAGNLLGNLLCAVAHLLDNTSASTNAIVTLLNNIIGILQTL